MLSYHSRVALADKALVSLKSQHPALIQTMEALRAHYLEGGVEKHSPHLLLAAARLLTQPNYREASMAISRDLGVSYISAENHVLDAVNNGPDFLKADEVLLHAKGIMRASDRYMLGRRNIHPGSVYDRAWHGMDPAYRPILAEAVNSAMNTRGGKRALEVRTMYYIAICLMPDDNQKYFELNAQSIETKSAHVRHLQDAVRFISGNAGRYGIKFPQDFLGNLEKSLCILRPLPAIPLTSPAAVAPEKARRDFSLGLDGQTMPEPQKANLEMTPEGRLSEGQRHQTGTVRP